MEKIRSLVFILVCAQYFACSNSADSLPENLSIDYLSVQDGDSLYPGAGLIASFNAAIDVSSFGAQEIHTTHDILYNDSTGINSYTINLQVYKIAFAQNVQVNGQPVSLWFNPTTNEIATFRETSNQMPYGTGEGLILNRDSTEIVFRADIAGQNGTVIGTDFKLYLHRAATNHQLRVVPNPAYPSYISNVMQYPQVNFRDLPESCIINIYDHANIPVTSLQHYLGTRESWDLKDQNGTYISPGIYQFEIVYNTFPIEEGVFLFPGFE